MCNCTLDYLLSGRAVVYFPHLHHKYVMLWLYKDCDVARGQNVLSSVKIYGTVIIRAVWHGLEQWYSTCGSQPLW